VRRQLWGDGRRSRGAGPTHVREDRHPSDVHGRPSGPGQDGTSLVLSIFSSFACSRAGDTVTVRRSAPYVGIGFSLEKKGYARKPRSAAAWPPSPHTLSTHTGRVRTYTTRQLLD